MKTTKAFTLIELLTVIAIIGILAGIIIPTVGAVKVSANKARTKAQFNQWATSLELFKQEYGYYPNVATSNKINPTNFIAALSARDHTGARAEETAKTVGNKKMISFYSFSDNDIFKDDLGNSENMVIDAFRNSDIAIFLDTNGDGRVDGLSAVGVRAGNTEEGQGKTLTPAAADIPSDGVRAGAAFYSAGKGEGVKDIVYSWK